ncbi:MAG: OmpA family protein [bacterium]|nr:OmpA family protein [Candidatus Limimorpha equi]
MKKAFITMCAVLIASVSMAAGRVDSVRYMTTKAGQNWFISARGTMDWWQGSDKNPGGNFTKVQWDKMSFGCSFSVGKWINHKVGVRLSYDINGFNSYVNGRDCNMPFLYIGDDPLPCSSFDYNGKHYDYYDTHGMYHIMHADFMFSPVDFFQGYYNSNRVWTPVLYFGMGAVCTSEYFFVLKSFMKDEGHNFEVGWQGGLDNNFRINDYLDLNLNFNWSGQRWTSDAGLYEYGNESIGNHERPTTKKIDHNYSVGLGLIYYFGGRVYELPVNCEREMKEMSQRIKHLENELEATATAVAVVPAPADTVVIYKDNIEAISYPFSIFFNLDSYQLMSKRDLVNLREIANVAKANGYKLRLRGSCDSATASAEYNQKLSENRCRKIMMELLDMGFPEEDIILEPVGGVKELESTEFDRRVLIDLIKYHE